MKRGKRNKKIFNKTNIILLVLLIIMVIIIILISNFRLDNKPTGYAFSLKGFFSVFSSQDKKISEQKTQLGTLSFKSSKPNFESGGYDSFKNINQTISVDYVLDLGITVPIYSLSINGIVSLNSDSSLIRVVLADKNNNEYLVYEGYTLIEDNSMSLDNVCEETCALDGIVPTSLKIQIEDASIDINTIIYSTKLNSLKSEIKQKGIKQYQKEIKQFQDDYKINKINSKDKKWFAGETSVSQLSYSEKKGLFDRTKPLPNLYGAEYYKEGLFTMPAASPGKSGGGSTTQPSPPTSDLVAYPGAIITPPSAWDWRNRSGENWLTPIRNQGGCGSCWDFSAVGTTESFVNLYYNQHLNLDLSEQDVLSCSNAGTCAGGWPSSALSYIQNTGVVDEICMPYKAIDASGCNAYGCTYAPVNCSSKCATPSKKIKIGGVASSSGTESDIKLMIVQKGTPSGIVYAWNHAMAMAGYGIVSIGEKIYAGNVAYSSYKNVQAGDPDIGKTYWIFKNSWGTGYGEAGYMKLLFQGATFSSPGPAGVQAPTGPITSNIIYNISCVDKDNDSYCNWGVGAKPSSCSINCNSKEDCDDSNPTIGACNFSSQIQAYVSICRQYLSNATYCPNTGNSCPTGYYASNSGKTCSGKGKNAVKWMFCYKDFSYCGKCPSGTLLAAYNYCSGSQTCITDANGLGKCG